MEDIVATDDCEFERVGLPGLTLKNRPAGDGIDGTRDGLALVMDGEAVFIGEGTGGALADPAGIAGWLIVGCGPL